MFSAVAYQQSDFALVRVHAGEVERYRSKPSRFELVATGLNVLAKVSEEWDRLPTDLRDVLRHLAKTLMEDSKQSFLGKQLAGIQAWFMIARRGVDEVSRQAHEVIAARDLFLSVVLGAEERENTELQEKLSAGIAEALNQDPVAPRARISRGQVGEWIKRLPS